MELTPELQKEVQKYKDKGNPVCYIKLSGEDYFYIGLLREDLATIRDTAIVESKKIVDALTKEEKEDPKVQQEVMSKIDDLEEVFVLSYAIFSPKMDLDKVGKLPAGVSKRLRDEIFRASGELEEASEPVKL